MHVHTLDHLVLAVDDVATTCRFYACVLGMEPREERRGKWSLYFGACKISLQDARASPRIARDTVPGSGNFCVLTDIPMAAVVAHLEEQSVEIVEGPAERVGAGGPILSVCLKDPDGNLVEIGNRLSTIQTTIPDR